MSRKKLPRNLAGVILVGALFFLFPKSASADTLIQIAGVNFSATGPLFLQPFDHTLGTLTSVDVTIDGQISAQVATNPNFVVIDQFGDLAPAPIPFTVALDQTFSGIPSNSFFSFSLQPATFQLNGIGSGAGEVEQVSSPFVYTFHFDANSDFVGFTGISSTGPLIPPVLASGTLAGFTDTLSPLMEEFIVTEPSKILLPALNGTLLTWSDQGAIVAQYNYTPAAFPTPEPSSLLLLGTGLIGLAGAMRRKWLA